MGFGPGTQVSHMTRSTDPDGVHTLRIETLKADNSALVILRGESDLATLPALEGALEDLELDGATSVHLHVDQLDFADASTIRRLTEFARRAKKPGRDIKTWGVRPLFRKVAYLLEVQDDLGLA